MRRVEAQLSFMLTGDPMSIPLTRTSPLAGRSILAAHILAAVVALAFGSAAVRAADLAIKAPQAPTYQWTGCYVGLNLGGGTSGTNFSSSVGPGTHLLGADPAVVAGSGGGGFNADGPSAGGQVGCNWQSGMLVLGLEGDFDYFHGTPGFSNNTNTLSDGVTPFTISQSLTTNYLATVRPRIGIGADRNLAYITGGVAFTQVSYTESYTDGAVPPGAGSASASRNLVGWTAGAGWEYALADHWTVRAEYLIAGFPKTSALGAITDAAGGSNPLGGSSDVTIQLLRAGVNFTF
jgi:outer membrane immunogenic protein